MEEIDIIELLKRVKEGKAPKEIIIRHITYKYRTEWNSIETMYVDKNGDDITNYSNIDFDTKIKILDKPIIEELDYSNNVNVFDVARKINEIIRYINKGE